MDLPVPVVWRARLHEGTFVTQSEATIVPRAQRPAGADVLKIVPRVHYLMFSDVFFPSPQQSHIFSELEFSNDIPSHRYESQQTNHQQHIDNDENVDHISAAAALLLLQC